MAVADPEALVVDPRRVVVARERRLFLREVPSRLAAALQEVLLARCQARAFLGRSVSLADREESSLFNNISIFWALRFCVQKKTDTHEFF